TEADEGVLQEEEVVSSSLLSIAPAIILSPIRERDPMDLAGFQVLLFLRETTRKPFLMRDRLSCCWELLWASSQRPGANSVRNGVGLVPINKRCRCIT